LIVEVEVVAVETAAVVVVVVSASAVRHVGSNMMIGLDIVDVEIASEIQHRSNVGIM
jgi:hypothetical protein